MKVREPKQKSSMVKFITTLQLHMREQQGQVTRLQDGVAHLGQRNCQLQAKHILCLQERHAKEHVCIHATREGTWASNQDHLKGQCRQKQKAGHSSSFARLEAQESF